MEWETDRERREREGEIKKGNKIVTEKSKQI